MGDTVEENYNTGGFAMKNTPLILGVFLLAGILATPATAFSINTLAVNLLENGDAEVTVDYSLSWRERFAVYTRIAHPEQDLESAFVSFSGRDVRIESVSPARTELRIEGFADIAKDETGTTYTTPAMDFSMAEQKVRDTGCPGSSPWISPLPARSSPSLTGMKPPLRTLRISPR